MEKIEPQIPQEPKLSKNVKIKKILVLLIVFVGFNFFAWGTLYLTIVKNNPTKEIKNESSANNASQRDAGASIINPSPTPFPFAEMTIPYLRSRPYKSSLGELKQVSTNSKYTSYLTSYDSDGLKVNGLLSIPRGSSPNGGWPAIVFVHGYIPPKNYQTLSNYQLYVDFLAKNGFAVFKIDLRGNGDSEGESGGSYFSGDYIVDTLNAYSALKNSEFVNPDKIGLWGHSMAGNVVSRALAAMPDIPAVVIWAGAVYTYEDFFENSIQDSSYQPPDQDSEVRKKRLELFEVNGNFDPKNEFWSQVPMTNYLEGITGAISLNHAVNDNVVSVDYSRNFNKILDGTYIIHELNEYSSGGHNITGEAFNQAMDNTVRFFNKNL